MNYSPSSRDAIDEHCREVIRSCLNLLAENYTLLDAPRTRESLVVKQRRILQ